MSWHHFIDHNKSRLLEDMKELNLETSDDIWQEFYQKYSYTNKLEFMEKYIENQFGTQLPVQEYWKYRVKKYLTQLEASEQIYPLVNSTDNLIKAHQLNINYFDGMYTVDTLRLYSEDYMIEFDIETKMKGSWNDGIEMEVEWISKTKSKDVSKHNQLLFNILESAKEIDRLGEMDPLWKLLDEESWIQRQLVKIQYRK
jgi:hypothetical protein